jgi:hypothetical protein
MTIAERQAREAYDRENPWRPMDTAPKDGLICELLFNSMVGHFQTETFTYFQDADGDWYQVEPPERVWQPPINWRPARVKLTIERRILLKKRAHESTKR